MRPGRTTVARLHRAMGATAAALLLALPAAGSAQVRETVNYKHYPVAVGANESLARALARATPIRPRWWQRFQGLTVWNITWTYDEEQAQPGGTCRAVEPAVELVSEITLPELTEATEAQRRTFTAYLPALKEHELGHHGNARAAAEQILAEMRALAPFRDCGALGAQVRRLTDALIEQARANDRRYDDDTRYGRTQGAYLEP